MINWHDKEIKALRGEIGKFENNPSVSYDPRENKGQVLFFGDTRGEDRRMFSIAKCNRIKAGMERKMKKTAALLRKNGYAYIRVEKITWDGNTYFGGVNFKFAKGVR